MASVTEVCWPEAGVIAIFGLVTKSMP